MNFADSCVLWPTAPAEARDDFSAESAALENRPGLGRQFAPNLLAITGSLSNNFGISSSFGPVRRRCAPALKVARRKSILEVLDSSRWSKRARTTTRIAPAKVFC